MTQVTMTNAERRRTVEALDETNRLLEKEMRHAPDLRKMDYVASLERHIAKLVGYLETNSIPDWRTWKPGT